MALLKRSHFDPISVGVFARQLTMAKWVVLLVFGILVFRLWFLQVPEGPFYRAKSENNRIRLQDIPPFRGIILDRNGEVLVKNRPSYDLYVIPEEIQDQEALLNRLAEFTGLDRNLAEEKLNGAARGYPFKPVLLKRDMDRDELARIETHRYDLAGAMIRVGSQRSYVHGQLASHVLGYLGEITRAEINSRQFPDNRSGDIVGKMGIERQWHNALNGKRGGEQVEVDAAGRIIGLISKRDPIQGADICLTLDKDLQARAEEVLQDKHGAIVAMDPTTGEILALASSPSYDPNQFIRGIDRETWQQMTSSADFPLQNRALSGQYPPGSVFKIVVALAGLQEGVFTPEEEVFCNGSYNLGTHTYRCWKRTGHGRVNLDKSLVESCDVYYYQMGKRLGVDRIARYAKMMGLGRETGLDPGHEKAGLIPTREWKLRRFGIPWQLGETTSVSIGQSFVLATPIQMAALVSAVFNGGIVYKPQLTKWVREQGKRSLFEMSPSVVTKLDIRPEHLEKVKKSLAGVVNKPQGTGSRSRLPGITVAGKTGTSQVVALKRGTETRKESDIPRKHRDHAWFVAVAPVESPKIVVSVVIEHGGTGGGNAAPVAREILQSYLQVSAGDSPTAPPGT